MRFEWDEAKRLSNIDDHQVDFIDMVQIFDGRPTSFTAEEIEAMRRRGEGRTDWAMSQEEAMRRRRADAEAPLPYEGCRRPSRSSCPSPRSRSRSASTATCCAG